MNDAAKSCKSLAISLSVL